MPAACRGIGTQGLEQRAWCAGFCCRSMVILAGLNVVRWARGKYQVQSKDCVLGSHESLKKDTDDKRH
jgi:hypothetical protein